MSVHDRSNHFTPVSYNTQIASPRGTPQPLGPSSQDVALSKLGRHTLENAQQSTTLEGANFHARAGGSENNSLVSNRTNAIASQIINAKTSGSAIEKSTSSRSVSVGTILSSNVDPQIKNLAKRVDAMAQKTGVFVELANRTSSANTVARMSAEFFVNEEQLKNLERAPKFEDKDYKIVDTLINQATQETIKNMDDEDPLIKKFLGNLSKVIISNLKTKKMQLRRQPLTLQHLKDAIKEGVDKLSSFLYDSTPPKAQLSKEKFNIIADQFSKYANQYTLKQMPDSVSNLNSFTENVSKLIDNVPKWYKRQDVQSILNSIELKGEFLSESELLKLKPGIDLSGTLPHYSSVDILAKNGNSWLLEEALVISQNENEREGIKGIFMKSASGEGQTEIKVITSVYETSLKNLDFTSCLSQKSVVQMNGAVFENTKNPVLLVSKEVKGNSLNAENWNRWGEAKYEYLKAKSSGMTINEDLESKFQNSKQAVYETMGSPKSLAQNIVFDCIFNPTDNHPNQYKMDEHGDVKNIDYGRFGSPEIVKAANGEHFALFRSVFLDHPIAQEPLENQGFLSDIAAQIKTIDPEKLVLEWDKKGLIASEESFEKQELRLDECKSDYKLMNNTHSKKIIEQLAVKYGVSLASEISDETLKAALNSKINEKHAEIKAENWGKMHPIAIKELKERIVRMQEYINDSTNAPLTLENLFYASQPDVAPFMQAVSILRSNPGNNLWLSGGQLNSLEKILQDFKLTYPEPSPQQKALVERMEIIIAKDLGVNSKLGGLMDPGCLV